VDKLWTMRALANTLGGTVHILTTLRAFRARLCFVRRLAIEACFVTFCFPAA
jgi:hypothetical protein